MHYTNYLREKLKQPFNVRVSEYIRGLANAITRKETTLYHFKTPKRSFFKSCRNFQEALAVFRKESGNNTMIEIAATNSGFKATRCQRLGR